MRPAVVKSAAALLGIVMIASIASASHVKVSIKPVSHAVAVATSTPTPSPTATPQDSPQATAAHKPYKLAPKPTATPVATAAPFVIHTPQPTPVPDVIVNRVSLDFCPDGTPAQGSCEDPTGPKGSNICYHAEDGAMTAGQDIYCWALTIKPNTDKGGFDYFCNYLYYDGNQAYGTFMLNAPDKDQGVTCLP